MPESKQMPEIKRLQGGVIIPYNVQQVTRTNEDNEQETFYTFNRIKLDQHLLPSLSETAQHIRRQLQTNLHEYIYSHYDQGTQASLQAIFNDADITQATKDKIQAIWDWIRKTDVLPYYYQKKNEIRNVTTVDELIQVNWDFNQFDATKPSYILEEIITE